MVALESLPLGLTIFTSFWQTLIEAEESGHETEKEFLNLLCTNCNNFRDYVLSVLNQERRFLNQDEVFDFFKNLAPKVCIIQINSNRLSQCICSQVKLMQITPQLSTLSASLTSEILRLDQISSERRDPEALLSVSGCQKQDNVFLNSFFDRRCELFT